MPSDVKLLMTVCGLSMAALSKKFDVVDYKILLLFSVIIVEQFFHFVWVSFRDVANAPANE